MADNKVKIKEEELEKVSGGITNYLEVMTQILIALQPYGQLVFEYPNDPFIISKLNQIATADLSVYPIDSNNQNIIELREYLEKLANQ